MITIRDMNGSALKRKGVLADEAVMAWERLPSPCQKCPMVKHL